jgi:hypothetical protein
MSNDISTEIFEPVINGVKGSELSMEQILATPCPITDEDVQNLSSIDLFNKIKNGFVLRAPDLDDYPTSWYIAHLPLIRGFKRLFAENEAAAAEGKPEPFDFNNFYFEPSEMFITYILNGQEFTLEHMREHLQPDEIAFLFKTSEMIFTDSSPVADMLSQIMPINDIGDAIVLAECGMFKKEVALEANPSIKSNPDLANEISLTL